jgi:hypothetical protein
MSYDIRQACRILFLRPGSLSECVPSHHQLVRLRLRLYWDVKSSILSTNYGQSHYMVLEGICTAVRAHRALHVLAQEQFCFCTLALLCVGI